MSQKNQEAMIAKRKNFSKEFKLEAVGPLELGNKSPNDISINLGIRRIMLYKWQEQLKNMVMKNFRLSIKNSFLDKILFFIL